MFSILVQIYSFVCKKCAKRIENLHTKEKIIETKEGNKSLSDILFIALCFVLLPFVLFCVSFSP